MTQKLLPILTVILALLAAWYVAVVPMNIKSALTTAERAGADGHRTKLGVEVAKVGAAGVVGIVGVSIVGVSNVGVSDVRSAEVKWQKTVVQRKCDHDDEERQMKLKRILREKSRYENDRQLSHYYNSLPPPAFLPVTRVDQPPPKAVLARVKQVSFAH